MLFIHRTAHFLNNLGIPIIPRLLYIINRILFAIALPPSAVVGRNVVFGYSGLGIVIHARSKIGDRVVIGPGVTIGGRSGFHDVPTIESDVEIGAGAKILGPINIGVGSKIGANAVVLQNVPPHSTVVGIPGRVIFSKSHLP